MGNLFIAWDNKADGGTLSGGSWEASLPLTNMQDRRLAKKARSIDATLASTKFDNDLGASKAIRLVAIISNNLTIDAKAKITGANDAAFTDIVYDSGFFEVYPAIFPPSSGAYFWGVDPVWTGKIAAADLEGYTLNLIHIISTLQLARYWRVEIDDTANGDGFVEIGRLLMAPGWQVARNYSFGAKLGFDDLSLVDRSLGGALFVEERKRLRVFRFDVASMDRDEAMTQAFELQRRKGITGEVLVIPDPDETVHLFREAFFGRLRQLGEIERYAAALNRTAFEIEELV